MSLGRDCDVLFAALVSSKLKMTEGSPKAANSDTVLFTHFLPLI